LYPYILNSDLLTIKRLYEFNRKNKIYSFIVNKIEIKLISQYYDYIKIMFNIRKNLFSQ